MYYLFDVLSFVNQPLCRMANSKYSKIVNNK